jgi:hypothetical protein
VKLKRKYLTGDDPEKLKGIAWRGRRRGGAAGGHSGIARIKGAMHPIGLSGRTSGRLTRGFRERDKRMHG